MGRLLLRAMLWAALGGLWFCLIFRTSVADAVNAAVVATLVLWAARVMLVGAEAKFSPPAGWGHALASLPWKLVKDTGLVLGALLRGLGRREELTGRLVRVPLEAGDSDPQTAARYAVVVAAVSLTPNTVVILHDRARLSLVVHELVPSSPPLEERDPRWPV